MMKATPIVRLLSHVRVLPGVHEASAPRHSPQRVCPQQHPRTISEAASFAIQRTRGRPSRMWAGLLYNFIALFVIIDTVGTAALFAALTHDESAEHRRRTAIRGVLIATVVLLAFAVIGEFLLRALGTRIPAFRLAGRILPFFPATEMVFARHS